MRLQARAAPPRSGQRKKLESKKRGQCWQITGERTSTTPAGCAVRPLRERHGNRGRRVGHGAVAQRTGPAQAFARFRRVGSVGHHPRRRVSPVFAAGMPRPPNPSLDTGRSCRRRAMASGQPRPVRESGRFLLLWKRGCAMKSKDTKGGPVRRVHRGNAGSCRKQTPCLGSRAGVRSGTRQTGMPTRRSRSALTGRTGCSSRGGFGAGSSARYRARRARRTPKRCKMRLESWRERRCSRARSRPSTCGLPNRRTASTSICVTASARRENHAAGVGHRAKPAGAVPAPRPCSPCPSLRWVVWTNCAGSLTCLTAIGP